MQQEKLDLKVEKRYKSAFEKSVKENCLLKERLNLQEKKIKNLKRKVENKKTLLDYIKEFFGIKKKQGHNANCPRPLRLKENQRKLIEMLEKGFTIKEIIIETGWKRDNITEFIRVHGLRSLVKEWK